MNYEFKGDDLRDINIKQKRIPMTIFVMLFAIIAGISIYISGISPQQPFREISQDMITEVFTPNKIIELNNEEKIKFVNMLKNLTIYYPEEKEIPLDNGGFSFIDDNNNKYTIKIGDSYISINGKIYKTTYEFTNAFNYLMEEHDRRILRNFAACIYNYFNVEQELNIEKQR